MTSASDRHVAAYLGAERRIIDAGYSADIDWADGLANVKPDAEYVAREGAWVILNSGFKNEIANRIWPSLIAAFGHFKVSPTSAHLREARHAFLHRKKVGAMHKLAHFAHRRFANGGYGWQRLVGDAHADPRKLKMVDFIGPITCWHFAKLLGADVVKPDVHLVRAAHAAGYREPVDLARALQLRGCGRLTRIDSVLWRYGEQMKVRAWPGWDAFWKGDGDGYT